jgi:hypothetical protein
VTKQYKENKILHCIRQCIPVKILEEETEEVE